MLTRLVFTLVMLGTSLSAAPCLAAVERPLPMISVMGEATVRAAPDLALVSAGVSSDAKTPREASEANARVMTAVLFAAKQAGIDEKDVRTSGFSITPVYSQRRETSSQVTGYRVSNEVQVKVRESAKAADVLDQLIAAGATNVGVSYMVSEPEKLLNDARLAAFANARRKAELYAKAAGAQVGRTISITEDGDGGARPMSLRAAAAPAAGPATPLVLGEETLRVQVSVSFELSQ